LGSEHLLHVKSLAGLLFQTMALVDATPMEPAASFDFRSTAGMAAGHLDDILAAHDSQLAHWRRERLQALQAEVQKAACQLQQERLAVEDLTTELAATRQLAEEAAKLRAEGTWVLEAAREAAEEAAKRRELARSTLAQLEDVSRARREELEVEEQVLKEQGATMAGRIEEINRFLCLFKDRLGLVLTRVAPQTVCVAFTLLSAAAPEKEFTFTLGLAAVGSLGPGYRVEDCRPALPKHQIERLLGRLNSAGVSDTSALPAFVCAMRRAFQAL